MGEHWGPELPGTLGRPSCLVWYHRHPRALAVGLGPSGGCISEEKGVICLLISVVGTQSILESSRGRVGRPSRTGILLQHRGDQPLPGHSLGLEASPLPGRLLDPGQRGLPSSRMHIPCFVNPYSSQKGSPLRAGPGLSSSLHPHRPAHGGLGGGG